MKELTDRSAPGAGDDSRGPRDHSAFEIAEASAGKHHENIEIHRLLVETVRDYAIFALDRTGHVLTWNPGAERFKGYKPHEIIGKHFSVFYTAEDLASDKPGRELEIATREGQVEDEGWRVRKDGTRFWANVVITALRDPEGELIGFAKVTRDLTERRNAEEQLRQSEERLRLIVQTVRDYGIFMLDASGIIRTWNEGARAMYGYDAEEIIGSHFSRFYPDEARANGIPEMELRVAAKEGRYEDVGGWRVKKDGTQVWANVVITALHDTSGTLVGFAKVTRDLTERRRAQEREIEDARRVAAAEGENRAKSNFLASMSHELRTPLNAIGGYVDLLLMGVRGDVTPSQVTDLERIRRSQQHLLSVINEILNFSRIEAGRETYTLSSTSVSDSFDRAASMIIPLAAQKAIRLHAAKPASDVCVCADAPKVDQILLNLLSNAVKFTADGGEIWLDSSRRDGQVLITVRDNGLGIPADKQKDIFEPFVQVGRSLSSPAQGSGLGLAISRDLARGMKGDLSVQSEPGKGSVFTLSLPAG